MLVSIDPKPRAPRPVWLRAPLASGKEFTAVREIVREHRWWTADEIEASHEVFAPRRLGSLLREVLVEGPSPQPVDVGL